MSIRFLVESHYCEVRQDAGFWRPLVEEALRQQQVSMEAMVPVEDDSTNANFWFGNDKVLKIYTPFFSGRQSKGMEVAALRALGIEKTIPVPKLIARGELEPLAADWKWPFVLMERLPGQTLDSLWLSFTATERAEFAFRIGTLLGRMHRFVPPKDLSLAYQSAQPKGFADFLVRQQQLIASKSELAVIPIYEDILKMNPAGLLHGWPVLLHGDLDGTHILVDQGKVSGIIDFGDAKLGDPAYDFVTLHADLFKFDPTLLGEFLRGYGMDAKAEPRLRDRLIAYTVLHEWEFADNLPRWAVQSGANTLADLALWMWRL